MVWIAEDLGARVLKNEQSISEQHGRIVKLEATVSSLQAPFGESAYKSIRVIALEQYHRRRTEH
jgi:hypothetical protein